jgi:hypothetical protein
MRFPETGTIMINIRNLLNTGLALCVSTFSTGCSQSAAGTGKPINIERLVLYDSAPLWGGKNIYIARDGTLWVQIVYRPAPGQSGMQEQRYKLIVTPAQVAELEMVLGDHHFFDIHASDRPGIPDEARPTIRLTTPDGKTVERSKWFHDANADFDAIYSRILTVVPKDVSQTPTYAGAVDFTWHPDGFGQ